MTEIKEHAQKSRDRFQQLSGARQNIEGSRKSLVAQLEKTEKYLEVGEQVRKALETLNENLFQQVTDLLQSKLTIALQEVLEQEIALGVETSFKNNAAAISFHIVRQGHKEDIMKGQGGSVVNVLSVGLRMFALATLQTEVHRPFLVLDEQDCWLRPDLVPHLVRIVHEAGKELGFQILMISHHDVSCFRKYADRIYGFSPDPAGVKVELVDFPDPHDDPENEK